MIKADTFVKVDGEHLEDAGLDDGSFLYIGGVQAVPENPDDLYTQRIKFIVFPVVDDHMDTGKPIMVDPSSVATIPVSVQKRLRKQMEVDFGGNKGETSN